MFRVLVEIKKVNQGPWESSSRNLAAFVENISVFMTAHVMCVLGDWKLIWRCTSKSTAACKF